jgi:hypothetical protein
VYTYFKFIRIAALGIQIDLCAHTNPGDWGLTSTDEFQIPLLEIVRLFNLYIEALPPAGENIEELPPANKNIKDSKDIIKDCNIADTYKEGTELVDYKDSEDYEMVDYQDKCEIKDKSKGKNTGKGKGEDEDEDEDDDEDEDEGEIKIKSAVELWRIAFPPLVLITLQIHTPLKTMISDCSGLPCVE